MGLSVAETGKICELSKIIVFTASLNNHVIKAVRRQSERTSYFASVSFLGRPTSDVHGHGIKGQGHIVT